MAAKESEAEAVSHSDGHARHGLWCSNAEALSHSPPSSSSSLLISMRSPPSPPPPPPPTALHKAICSVDFSDYLCRTRSGSFKPLCLFSAPADEIAREKEEGETIDSRRHADLFPLLLPPSPRVRLPSLILPMGV